MKGGAAVILTALVLVTSCADRTYSESEIRSLLVGSWVFSSSFETNAAATHIQLKSHGKTTFKEDGTMVSTGDSLMTVDVSEGRLPVDYHAVVRAKWVVNGQALRIARTAEEISARDEISRKFIESDGMRKLRSESPTESVYSFQAISRRKIVALDSHGARTTYTREE